MKTNLKKALALLLATMFAAMALCLPVLATGTGTITIQAPTDYTGTRTYAAYRLFDASETDPVVYSFNDLSTAFFAQYESGAYADIASALAYVQSLTDEADLNAFGVELYNFISNSSDKATYNANFRTTAEMVEGQSTTISALDWGYYLIYDITDESNVRAAVAITSATPDATVVVKVEEPELEKKIVLSDGTLVDEATYNIGDTITFQITGTVPDMTGYTSYSYVVYDTMAAGLSYVSNSISVTIGGVTLARSTSDLYGSSNADGDYFATRSVHSSSGITTITVDIESILSGYLDGITSTSRTAYTTGDEIVITYQATLNQFAVIANPTGNATTENSNLNSVYLVSTDGTTTTDTVRVYTYEWEVTKVNALDGGDELEGATFYLVDGDATASDPYHIIEFGMYIDASGTVYYYPTGRTISSDDVADYLASTGTYDGNGEGTDGTWTVGTSTINYTTTILLECLNETDSGNSAMFNIIGLGEGTYSLIEQDAPSGYTACVDPIVFTIDYTFTDNVLTEVSLTPDSDSVGWIGMTSYDDTANVLDINVVNTTDGTSGTLPETGGIGTTIFTIVGLLLMVGAVSLYGLKRRAS